MGKALRIMGFIIILFIGSIFAAAIIGVFINTDFGNVAVIDIAGLIVVQTQDSIFNNGDTSSDEIVKYLEKAENNPSIEAVILNINSPGGSPVASDEIARAVAKMNKPVVSVIREVGASGAYWIASASDYIIANRLSITGSIGVKGSYLEFAGLLNDYNITYNELTSGNFKEMGNPLKPLSFEEEELIKSKLQKIHQFFIEEVAKNRNMSIDQVEVLSTGEWFLGIEAKKNGLIDELGGMDEVIQYLEKQGISVNTVKYTKKKSLGSFLAGTKLGMVDTIPKITT